MIQDTRHDDKIFELKTEDFHFQKQLDGFDDTIAELGYVIRSLSEETIACRIRDAIDEQITDTDVYIHPGESDAWSVNDDGNVTFEGTLEPDTAISAQVSINIDSSSEIDPMDSEPTIDIAKPKSSRDQVEQDPEDSREITADASTEPSPTEPIEIPEEIELEPPPEEPSTDSGRGITESLLVELETGRVSSDDLTRLRKAMGIAETEPSKSKRSLDAKVEHLQTQVGDLLAYREALKQFIDEEGKGSEIVEEIKGEIRALDQSITTLEDAINSINESINRTRDRIDVVESDLDNRIDKLETDSNERIAAVRSELTDRFETISEEVEDIPKIQDDLDRLTEMVETNDLRLKNEVSELEETIGKIEKRLERMSDEYESEISELKSDVKAGKDWRESLGEALVSHDKS